MPVAKRRDAIRAAATVAVPVRPNRSWQPVDYQQADCYEALRKQKKLRTEFGCGPTAFDCKHSAIPSQSNASQTVATRFSLFVAKSAQELTLMSRIPNRSPSRREPSRLFTQAVKPKFEKSFGYSLRAQSRSPRSSGCLMPLSRAPLPKLAGPSQMMTS